jgi:hypothetical protein
MTPEELLQLWDKRRTEKRNPTTEEWNPATEEPEVLLDSLNDDDFPQVVTSFVRQEPLLSTEGLIPRHSLLRSIALSDYHHDRETK